MIIFTPNTVIKSADINLNFTELKTKTDYLTTPDTNWVTVAANGNPQPSFMNGWVNYDTSYTEAAFRKDALGYVHIKGMIKNGAVSFDNAIFQLPVGYTPTRRYLFSTISNSAIGRIDIRTDGYVTVPTGNNAWITLDGIHFKAEQ